MLWDLNRRNNQSSSFVNTDYRLGRKGGCWSPVTTRLLLSQDNRTAARTESLSSQNDQVGEQEEV